ncbi:D-2-hydroxyacid dehydrogenase [Paenibacillus sp. J5C_2022]|uniref:D-2-hydroxyacid dehydrogenase n=1 Tax=Paenibacillus sp. J5C2022 TaxID=2977129 RepID=UPI0021CEEA2E|nr:D-2-hydroxyacid dehydrogenase [Paenibacillus sp. J5C2022]MCU6711925.1 D-2-hydroxyacid dehydrogenase [Paenibacillus sp. J5C2022]
MKIVVLDGYTVNPGDLSWGELEKLGELTVYERTSQDQIVERAQGAQILLTNKTPLHAETLSQLPELMYIGVLATGYDVIDVDAASRQGVIVTNIPAYSTDSVAQYTIALMLELCHQIGRHADSVRQGDWAISQDWSYWNYPLLELTGKTFGVVGAGRIGLQAARIASALGMNIAALNRSGHSRHDVGIPHLKWVEMDELLQCSDVISLHCPLTASNEGFMNKDSLLSMKRSAFLINTARGKLVNEEDLAYALNNDWIAGAALDVLSSEPPSPDHPLLSAKHCIITPHMAWATKEARGRLMDTTVHHLIQFLQGKPVHVVHPR